MDNTTILYNAIQRTYRNAIVGLIRERLEESFGESGIEEVKRLFAKRNAETGETQWEGVRKAAQERRSGGTGELSTTIRDEYELLGVEYFFNVFEVHFDVLCPNHAEKPKKERNQARQTLTGWMKQIKNTRDPISHPVADDINYADAVHVLYCARKALDFCGLPNASSQILRLHSTLLGGYSGDDECVLTSLPPEDEVVMGFVGRHQELATLSQWLAKNLSRRWALSGEGGKGKSATAYAFGKSVATRDDLGLDAILWMSAKRRRFVEGVTVLVDRPDFYDKASAIQAILRFFGEEWDSPDEAESRAIDLLTDFPTLLIVDDIDTVQGEGEDAIPFLVMAVPERTASKVLLTSRKELFGLSNVTTQVVGLAAADAEDFIKAKCDLMGIPLRPVLEMKSSLLEVTDSSPLYIEDLLRLHQTGLPIDKSIGLWRDKRGVEARVYAIQREFDQLNEDARQVLLTLSITGECSSDEVCRTLDWREDRLVDAMSQLRKMFLMPSRNGTGAKERLSLNSNTKALVRDVFSDTEAFRRTERLLKAARGELKPKRAEEKQVEAILRRVSLSVGQGNFVDAEDELEAAVQKFPGRTDLIARLAWLQKRKGDFASARESFQRTHDLGCTQRDAYWHWSDLEASVEEWTAAVVAAEFGIERCGRDKGLLFRLGYALHRQGRELLNDGEDGSKLCRRAIDILEEARTAPQHDIRNFAITHQIYRAIALNLESLEEEKMLAHHMSRWQSDCPDDPYLASEYERLRERFPRYLRAH
ncbi:tetratricopeptide repeat protein [Bremerella sp. JC770]|uniref:tetratricopeptide repeat protein n=1 Tax=Bremerella sp. JC770 TaxID=3232137 RepID=UPI00345866FC